MLKAERPSNANYKAISARPVKDGVLSTLCFQNSLYLRELMTISLSQLTLNMMAFELQLPEYPA